MRLYWPAALRSAFDALLAIDDAMGAAVAGASQPALGAIKLAWWREQLERLDQAPPPAEPRLRAAASELLPRGISGRDLAGLEAGWAALLEEQPDAALAADRGALLFALAARLLAAEEAPDEGRTYAIADIYRRGVMDLRRFATAASKRRFARASRPLTALAVLARRDLRDVPLEPEGTPARAWALLRHRLSGRL